MQLIQTNPYSKQNRNVSFGMNLEFKDSEAIAQKLSKYVRFNENQKLETLQKDFNEDVKIFEREISDDMLKVFSLKCNRFLKTIDNFKPHEFMDNLNRLFHDATKGSDSKILIEQGNTIDGKDILSLKYLDKKGKSYKDTLNLYDLFKNTKTYEPNHESIIKTMYNSYEASDKAQKIMEEFYLSSKTVRLVEKLKNKKIFRLILGEPYSIKNTSNEPLVNPFAPFIKSN